MLKNQPTEANKRHLRHDRWFYCQLMLAILSWLTFLIALIISYYAAPEKDYGVLRYYDVTIRQFWLTPLTGYLYVLLWLSAFLSYLTLIIKKYLSRRQRDNKYFSLKFLLAVNILWLAYILSYTAHYSLN